MVRGTQAHAEALREGIAAVLATMGLALSPERPDHPHRRGLDFLGWRIQRHRKKGTSRHYVYVYPSTKAVLAVKRKIKALGRAVEPINRSMTCCAGSIRRCGAGRAISGPGCPRRPSPHLSHYAWQTVWRRMLRKHRKATRTQLRHRYCGGGWWPATEDHVLIDLTKIGTTRYRYRGSVIPSPWPLADEDATTTAA